MKKIILIIFLILTIVFLTGCSNKNDENLKTKAISELDYLDSKIIEMLNKLNNISFENYSIISKQVKLSSKDEKAKTEEKGGEGSANEGEKQEENKEKNNTINSTSMVANTELNKNREDINWDELRIDIEQLNESWAVIVLDLYTLNASNNTILNFSEQINKAMIEIKAEDKQKCLETLANMYTGIPEILQEIKADINIQKKRQTQKHIIDAYILANDMTNSQINSNITQAINVYSEIMSNIDYTKNKSEKTNKIYVLLNEMFNSVVQKDSDIFYIKYKNFMKEIEEL